MKIVREQRLHNRLVNQEARQAMGMEAVGREVWTAEIRGFGLQKNTG